LGSSPSRTWQDLVDLVEYNRMWQIAVDCHRIAVRLPSRGRSLIAESVEIGRRVQGVTGVSRNRYARSIRSLRSLYSTLYNLSYHSLLYSLTGSILDRALIN